MLGDFKIRSKEPIKVLCDNKSAISIAHYPRYRDWMKHININCFYITENLQKKIRSIVHVGTSDKCVDIFTKGLASKNFFRLLCRL